MGAGDVNEILRAEGPEALREAFDAEITKQRKPNANGRDTAHGAKPTTTIKATPHRWRDPAAIPPREWIFRRHYIRRFVTTTVAPGGVGKTTLAIAEALAMATGRKFLSGERSASGPQVRVWYWNGEDPREEIERRIAATCQHHGIDAECELNGWLFYDSGHEVPIKFAAVGAGGKVQFDDDAIAAFTKAITDNEIDVVILDPFISCHGVPENDNVAIDQVVKKLGLIAAKTNSAIEILHHVRKPSQRQTQLTTDDARGGGAIVNTCRSARVLNRMTEAEAIKAGIEPSHRRWHFRVDKDKANMAPPEVAVWARLASEQLPNGDNVAVVEHWAFPSAFAGVTTDDMHHVRTAAAGGNYRADVRSDHWIGRVVAERLGLDLNEKSHRARIARILKKWMDTGVLAVEERIDQRRRKRKFVVPGDWSDGKEDIEPTIIEDEFDAAPVE